MDLSKLNTQETAEITHRFEIVHPTTGEGLKAYIDVFGQNSDAVKQFEAKQLRKFQKMELDNQKSRKPKLRELDELRKDALENALVRIAGWEAVEWEGKTLEFSAENARKMLEACTWLQEQVIEQSSDLGNFLKA
ncbi:hypothetical protein A4G18_00420 [Pasteurellaceae bacterium Pebbles2]|nr:hypothetical protein [Pasteurellaceae bacterium Pebbles2]